ncbi:MAG: septum formation initiator family protein, partial [Clostridia bacterium]|nr:septum formation initiator family protein [Clostridia bacterium]
MVTGRVEALLGDGWRRGRQRRLRLHLRRLLTVVFLLYVALLLVRTEWQIGRLRQRIAETQRALSAEAARTRALQAELQAAETDAYVEKLAREELGLVRPGEIAYN